MRTRIACCRTCSSDGASSWSVARATRCCLALSPAPTPMPWLPRLYTEWTCIITRHGLRSMWALFCVPGSTQRL